MLGQLKPPRNQPQLMSLQFYRRPLRGLCPQKSALGLCPSCRPEVRPRPLLKPNSAFQMDIALSYKSKECNLEISEMSSLMN